MRFGAWELAIILVIILVLFGVGKLPQVMRSLGKGVREAKGAVKGIKDEVKEIEDEIRK
jgi:sec-independent protein translocase protein TatA